MTSSFYNIEILSNQKDEENKIRSEIKIGPLRKGNGLTIGNALRRSVFINLEGIAITSFYLSSLTENLDSSDADTDTDADANTDADALREDIFELSLNLQNVILKSEKIPISCEGIISKSGPCIITAKDIVLPTGVNVINPSQYILCVNENYSVDIVLDIRSGRGYNILDSETQKSMEETREEYFKCYGNPINSNSIVSENSNSIVSENSNSILSENSNSILFENSNSILSENPNSILAENPKQLSPSSYALDYMKVDSIFTPIESFSFQVEIESKPDPNLTTNTTVVEQTSVAEQSEYLYIDLTTNGSISPYEAIQKASKELINLFTRLESFDSPSFDSPSKEVYFLEDSSKTKEKTDLLNLDMQIKNKQTETLSFDSYQKKESQPKEFKNYPLEKLKISKRILNSLKRANYTKIADLLESSHLSLKNVKNFGKKSLEELKSALNDLGISL